MIKHEIFATPVYAFDIEGIDNQALISLANQMREEQNGNTRRYNSDGKDKHNNWQSEDIDHWKQSEVDKLYRKVLNCVMTILPDFTSQKDVQVQRTNCWFNINGKGSFVSPHQHPGSTFAAVYYLQTSDESAQLKFMHPDKSMSWCYPSWTFGGERTKYTQVLFSVKPKVGQLLLFPSALQHYVDASEEDAERISMAFNPIIRKNQPK